MPLRQSTWTLQYDRSRFLYTTNCTEACGEDITAMVDAAQEITWATFRRHVQWQTVQEKFPMYSYRGEKVNPNFETDTLGFHIKDDYAVRFYRSVYGGLTCFYIEHSCIEYIWTPRNICG